MKAKSRRRLLISSVAMLLVAMLALGTATFAWFTTDTSATADGIAFRTTKSSELKISRVDLDWTDEVHYGFNKPIKPASSADGINWFTGVAAAKTAFDVNSTGFTAISGAANIGDKTANSNAGPVYVFDDMLNIKNAGGTDCTNVTITVSADFASACGRIAIVPCDAQTAANTRSSITAANFKANIYGSTATRTWNGVKAAGAASESTVEAMSLKAAANNATITVGTGTLAPDAVASYRVLVWMEGQDAALYDQTADGLSVGSITFSVTGDTAA